MRQRERWERKKHWYEYGPCIYLLSDRYKILQYCIPLVQIPWWAAHVGSVSTPHIVVLLYYTNLSLYLMSSHHSKCKWSFNTLYFRLWWPVSQTVGCPHWPVYLWHPDTHLCYCEVWWAETSDWVFWQHHCMLGVEYRCQNPAVPWTHWCRFVILLKYSGPDKSGCVDVWCTCCVFMGLSK